MGDRDIVWDPRRDDLEEHLLALGVLDHDRSRVLAAFDAADAGERERLNAYGDARLVREIRKLRAEDPDYVPPDAVPMHTSGYLQTGSPVEPHEFHDGSDGELECSECGAGPEASWHTNGDADEWGAGVKVEGPDGEPLEPIDTTALESMTIDEVLAWVADDPERAAAARDYEAGYTKPRTTLLERLAKIIEAG